MSSSKGTCLICILSFIYADFGNMNRHRVTSVSLGNRSQQQLQTEYNFPGMGILSRISMIYKKPTVPEEEFKELSKSERKGLFCSFSNIYKGN